MLSSFQVEHLMDFDTDTVYELLKGFEHDEFWSWR
jgi:hypothetical protein